MKILIKLKDWDVYRPNPKKMIYEDEEGNKYIGPPTSCMIGDFMFFEVISIRAGKEDYRSFIELLYHFSPKK